MAPWRHELQQETHKGVLRARRSLSLYNFFQRFACSRKGDLFLLLYPTFLHMPLLP
jgi:hypothetical protein